MKKFNPFKNAFIVSKDVPSCPAYDVVNGTSSQGRFLVWLHASITLVILSHFGSGFNFSSLTRAFLVWMTFWHTLLGVTDLSVMRYFLLND